VPQPKGGRIPQSGLVWLGNRAGEFCATSRTFKCHFLLLVGRFDPQLERNLTTIAPLDRESVGELEERWGDAHSSVQGEPEGALW
jgi:hypothetical protein